MSEFQRARTQIDIPELGTVFVRDVSMGLGMRLAQAIDAIPDDTFTPFHETLQPIYREIVVDCTVDGNGKEVLKSEDLDQLGFQSFMLLVKAARRTMLNGEEPSEDAKKN